MVILKLIWRWFKQIWFQIRHDWDKSLIKNKTKMPFVLLLPKKLLIYNRWDILYKINILVSFGANGRIPWTSCDKNHNVPYVMFSKITWCWAWSIFIFGRHNKFLICLSMISHCLFTINENLNFKNILTNIMLHDICN